MQTFYMDQPDRIIIDLTETNFEFAEGDEPKARGLISDIRFGRISEGRSRIVLTLISSCRRCSGFAEEAAR